MPPDDRVITRFDCTSFQWHHARCLIWEKKWSDDLSRHEKSMHFNHLINECGVCTLEIESVIFYSDIWLVALRGKWMCILVITTVQPKSIFQLNSLEFCKKQLGVFKRMVNMIACCWFRHRISCHPKQLAVDELAPCVVGLLLSSTCVGDLAVLSLLVPPCPLMHVAFSLQPPCIFAPLAATPWPCRLQYWVLSILYIFIASHNCIKLCILCLQHAHRPV